MTDTIFSNDAAAQNVQVPDDFPRPEIASSISGYQSKLALVEYEGKLYLPGGTPPELFVQWDLCEELAQHLAVKSMESKTGKRAHMSETEILDQYCVRLLETGWGSDAEMKWAIRRTAEILGWSVPAAAAADTQRKK